MTTPATPGLPDGLKLSPCPPVSPVAPGETPLKLRRVAIDAYRSLHQPKDKLGELLLAAPAARELGAQRLWLVAPYLADMRQDTAFMPGEVVSQRHVGRWLASVFDGVLTVDPHLHRVATLADAVPVTQPLALSAAPRLAQTIAARCDRTHEILRHLQGCRDGAKWRDANRNLGARGRLLLVHGDGVRPRARRARRRVRLQQRAGHAPDV
ncbi:hypothetical protein [Tepidimonas sp.]|uniref:hypothetical protein n=1 Tax=Tepidimonas sp. TaxID=2002775 RepID=UPI00391EF2E8